MRSGGLRAPYLPGRGRPRLAHGPRTKGHLEASSTVPTNQVQEKLKDVGTFQVNIMPLFSKRASALVLRQNLPRKRGLHQRAVTRPQRAWEGTSSTQLETALGNQTLLFDTVTMQPTWDACGENRARTTCPPPTCRPSGERLCSSVTPRVSSRPCDLSLV